MTRRQAKRDAAIFNALTRRATPPPRLDGVAGCRNAPHLFGPDQSPNRATVARTICKSCQLLPGCHAWAEQHSGEISGTFGGVTYSQRKPKHGPTKGTAHEQH